MSETNSSRIYRATTDSSLLDLPRAELTSGMQLLFAPVLIGLEALTGGGVKNLDGILTEFMPLPQVFDILGADSFSRWLLRARVDGEEESTNPDDAAKTKIIPDDDETLIWVRITGGSSGSPAGSGFSSGFSSGFGA